MTTYLQKPHLTRTQILWAYRNPITSSLQFSLSSFPLPLLHRISISLSNYLFHQHQFSPETLPNSFTGKFLKTPKKSDSILSFLKESGFLKTHLETVIKHAPRVLYANLDQTIKPKIRYFRIWAFAPLTLPTSSQLTPGFFPAVRQAWPVNSGIEQCFGFSGVSRVLKICGWFLKCDLEKSMMPNVEFLKSCRVSFSQIVKYMYNFPRLLLHKPESIMKFFEWFDELGMDRRSKGFLNAIRTISSMTVENWGLKLKLFRSLGFSEYDIVSVFRKVPRAFSVSEREIKENTRVLCGFGKSDISLIVSHPELLYLSVENRLKPRLRVVGILESKKLLQKKPSLTTVCKMSHKRFFEKFVLLIHMKSANLCSLVRKMNDFLLDVALLWINKLAA